MDWGGFPDVGNSPVSETAPFVAALHRAVPLVESVALLIWMSVGSGFDHVA